MRYVPFFKSVSGVVLGIGLSLLFGCSSVGSNPSSEATSQPIAQSPGATEAPVEEPIQPSPDAESSQTGQEEASQTGQEQVLPISAEANINGQTIQLEVAITPEQQAKGLMYRPPLPDDRGMLFPFRSPRYTRFWMKNTPSPLDMIFLREGEVKAIVANAPPCESDPCPTYGPDTFTLIDQVIELRSGRAAELGLEVGDRVEIRFFDQ